MSLSSNKSVTLLELLIAITILGFIILSISNLQLFSHHQVITSDRSAKIQNDISYVLEHMAKEAAKAIGNENVNGVNSVVEVAISPPDIDLRVYIDANGNGQREAPINMPPPGRDCWTVYSYATAGINRNRIRYCSRCRNANCVFNQCLDPVETLSRKIISFVPTKPVNPDGTLSDNYLDIQITACWEPDGTPVPCGTFNNPTVNMRSSVILPSVSTN